MSLHPLLFCPHCQHDRKRNVPIAGVDHCPVCGAQVTPEVLAATRLDWVRRAALPEAIVRHPENLRLALRRMTREALALEQAYSDLLAARGRLPEEIAIRHGLDPGVFRRFLERREGR